MAAKTFTHNNMRYTEVHVRECQECGHRQISALPSSQQNDKWRELKCKRCKSEAMDYGTTMLQNEYGKLCTYSDVYPDEPEKCEQCGKSDDGMADLQQVRLGGDFVLLCKGCRR